MAEPNGVKLFGFEIRRSSKVEKEEKKRVSIVPPQDEDGSGYVTSGAAGHYGQYVDINGDQAKDNVQLIMKYRGVSMHPEVDMAIEDIVNESIIAGGLDQTIEINLDNVEAKESVKNTINDEFKNVLNLLDFANNGHDIFRRWYTDGRLYHHLIIDDVKF